MPVQGLRGNDRMVELNLSLLQDLLGGYRPRDFAVRLWDGASWDAEPGQPARFTLLLKHPGALRGMFWPPGELALAEAYIYDDFDIEGRIEDVFGLADRLIDQRRNVVERLRYAGRLLSLPGVRRGDRPRAERKAARLRDARHSKAHDQQAAGYHYNVSNEFYALWLDERMVYSCAYFATPDEGLDVAQERKLDYICRKLRLRRGERLLDIGCGWGGLVMHAARLYGVKALGITLASRGPGWRTSVFAGPDWPIAAAWRCAIIGRSTNLAGMTSWSAWGCSSTWARPCRRNTSGGLIGCSARAAPSSTTGSPATPTCPRGAGRPSSAATYSLTASSCPSASRCPPPRVAASRCATWREPARALRAHVAPLGGPPGSPARRGVPDHRRGHLPRVAAVYVRGGPRLQIRPAQRLPDTSGQARPGRKRSAVDEGRLVYLTVRSPAPTDPGRRFRGRLGTPRGPR